MLFMAILIFHYTVSCTKSNTEIVKIESIKTVKLFSDSIYLSSQVSNLIFFNDRYYLSDYYRGIVSFNEVFESFTKEKVTDFLTLMPQCYMFTIDENQEWCIYDSPNNCFLKIQNDSVITKIPIGHYKVTLPSRCVFNEESILCAIIKNKMTAAIIGNEKISGTCFPTINGLDDIRKPCHSDRIIVRDNKNIYTIGRGLPIVQMYSPNLKLVSSYNLDTIDEIAKTVEQEKTDKPNSYFAVVKDAYAFNGNLFLLISSKRNGKYECNKILVLQNKNNIIEFNAFYELENKIYSTFCINKQGQLVVANAKTGGLEIYEI